MLVSVSLISLREGHTRCDINYPAFEHLWHITSKGRMEMAIDLIKLPQIL